MQSTFLCVYVAVRMSAIERQSESESSLSMVLKRALTRLASLTVTSVSAALMGTWHSYTIITSPSTIMSPIRLSVTLYK